MRKRWNSYKRYLSHNSAELGLLRLTIELTGEGITSTWR